MRDSYQAAGPLPVWAWSPGCRLIQKPASTMKRSVSVSTSATFRSESYWLIRPLSLSTKPRNAYVFVAFVESCRAIDSPTSSARASAPDSKMDAPSDSPRKAPISDLAGAAREGFWLTDEVLFSRGEARGILVA